MEVTLQALPSVKLPAPYRWVPWSEPEEQLLERHAEVKFRCFVEELDASVFPCLGERFGCLRLMREIRNKIGFSPAATWLITSPQGDCGTIQGVRISPDQGMIQNVGIVPEARHRGLGRALVSKCLEGFAQLGVQQVFLEVTDGNDVAIRLYRGLGFVKVKTLYKAVEWQPDSE